MNRIWTLIMIVPVLLLVLLTVMRSKSTGRSALYVMAVKTQYSICLFAAVLPTLATVIEELPERFLAAWHLERGDEAERLRLVRRAKSA